MTRLLIIGCGLIGGSVALAARRARSGLRVVGIDHPAVLASTRFGEVFDQGLAAGDPQLLSQALGEADLTVLATPVRAILQLLPRLEQHRGIVTDCGSTKRVIAEAAAHDPKFVPGHPMAGRPHGSLSTADAALFDGCQWILCPQRCTEAALDAVRAFVSDLGAHVVALSAEEHDAGVALTSHIPQLLASLLAVLGDAGPARSTQGPAFRSATRVAGGPESIWADILETNADSIAPALHDVAQRLERIASALVHRNTREALELLARARELRDAQR